MGKPEALNGAQVRHVRAQFWSQMGQLEAHFNQIRVQMGQLGANFSQFEPQIDPFEPHKVLREPIWAI